MSRVLSVLLSWSLLAATVHAQGNDAKIPVKSTATLCADREKLRDLLYIPRGYAKFFFGQMTCPSRDEMTGKEKKLTPAQEIDALKNQLTGTDADAEIHLKLSELFEDEPAGRAASAKAVELFEKQIAQDKQNGSLWAEYARALLAVDKIGPAEEAALKATELAPQDWRCWRALGFVRRDQMYCVLSGSDKLPWSFNFQNAVAEARNRRAPQADLDKAEKYLRAAGECHDKEVAAAPDEPEARCDRVAFYFTAMCLRTALPKPFGDPTAPPDAEILFPSALFHDVQQLTRSFPDNPEVHGFLGCIAFLHGTYQMAGKSTQEAQSEKNADDGNSKRAFGNWTDPSEEFKSIFEKISQKDRRTIREATAKLIELARKKDFSEKASRSLAIYSLMQGDLKTALRHARRITRLGPKDDENWDLLEMVLLGKAMHDFPDGDDAKLDPKTEVEARKAAQEIIKVSEQRLQHLPSARNHLLLAQMYVEAGEFAKAETALRAALKSDPDDVRCRIGLAVTLLLKSDQTSDLTEAQECLEKTRKSVMDANDGELQLVWNNTYGVGLALSGQVRQAKEFFETMLQKDSGNEWAKAALAAFSR